MCVKAVRIRRELAVVEFLFMLETVSHLLAKLALWTRTLSIEINRRLITMAVSVVYRPGCLKIEEFTKVLSLILDNTDLDKVETIILGDFNVDYSAKQNPLRRRMDEFAFLFNLTQINSKPTSVTETSKSIIDLILVNNSHKIVQCDVLNLTISGHNVIYYFH